MINLQTYDSQESSDLCSALIGSWQLPRSPTDIVAERKYEAGLIAFSRLHCRQVILSFWSTEGNEVIL